MIRELPEENGLYPPDFDPVKGARIGPREIHYRFSAGTHEGANSSPVQQREVESRRPFQRETALGVRVQSPHAVTSVMPEMPRIRTCALVYS